MKLIKNPRTNMTCKHCKSLISPWTGGHSYKVIKNTFTVCNSCIVNMITAIINCSRIAAGSNFRVCCYFTAGYSYIFSDIIVTVPPSCIFSAITATIFYSIACFWNCFVSILRNNNIISNNIIFYSRLIKGIYLLHRNKII